MHDERPPRTSDPRRTGGLGRRSFAAATSLAVVAVFLVTQVVMGAVEISVTDGLIGEEVARPDATEPGPVFYDNSDGITFESGLTNVETIWYAEIASARNNSSAESATIQGNVETFSDWFYGKQGSATKYASFNVTGVHDADAASYSVPLLFTKSSQGTLTVRGYTAAAPVSGGTDTTYFWAYDAGATRYVFGPSKDLSLATQIAPISDTLGLNYAFTLEANTFVVRSAGSAPNHLPTVAQGIHLPLLSLPTAVTWYVLMDSPAGVHEDTYDFELQVTAQGV